MTPELHYRRYWGACCLALGLLAGSNGCNWVADTNKAISKLADKGSPSEESSPRPIQVKVDSFGKPLREGHEGTMSRDEFLNRIDDLLGAQRFAAARLWVERYPDVALETLRATSAAEARRPAIVAVANAYDRQMELPADEGWQVVIADRGKRQREYAESDAARQAVLDQLRIGQPRKSVGSKLAALVEPAPGSMLDIDAWQLQSLALELDQRPSAAVESLRRALQYSERDRYQSAQLLLLLSDAQRRSELFDEAENTWQQAVELAASLVERPAPIVDPNFWDRAAYLRPVKRPWPSAVSQALAPLGSMRPDGKGDDAELLVWSVVGLAHLERNENQSALLALKRAETLTQDPSATGRFRLAQAKALVRMEQITAATAMLVALSNQKDPQLFRPALALLGGHKLRAGDSLAGYKLLSKALENADATDWKDRPQAEADMGLVCLMRGDEANGFRWLHQAQSRFEAEGDLASLARSLHNEASYLTHAKKKPEAAVVAQRLADLERR